MSEGWIKLHRCLLKKPIWVNSTHEQRTILITILMLANHEENKWEWNHKPFVCKPGQFITSISSLAKRCNVTSQKVRTALERFENFEFLTSESTNTGRLITIVNWEFYQHSDETDNKQDNKHLTSTQQALNKHLTTNKNIRSKEDKNEKKVYIVGQEELTFSEVCKGIVDYLNMKAGVNYKPSSQKTRDLIKARLNDGFSVDDFKTVIDKKVSQWKSDSKMAEYLRPETLFSNKFEGYLNQKSGTNQIDELMRIAREGL